MKYLATCTDFMLEMQQYLVFYQTPVQFNTQRQTVVFWYVLASHKTFSKHCTAAYVVQVEPLRSRDWCCAAF